MGGLPGINPADPAALLGRPDLLGERDSRYHDQLQEFSKAASRIVTRRQAAFPNCFPKRNGAIPRVLRTTTLGVSLRNICSKLAGKSVLSDL